jgi:hypothetical protein
VCCNRRQPLTPDDSVAACGASNTTHWLMLVTVVIITAASFAIVSLDLFCFSQLPQRELSCDNEHQGGRCHGISVFLLASWCIVH